MTLKDFLANRKKGESPHEHTKAYALAVERLMVRLKKILSPFDAFTVEEWLPLLKEHGVTYNAPALTLSVDNDQITIEPVGAYAMVGSKGRVRMFCGMREVHLDWAGVDDDWTFRWVNPQEKVPSPFTDEVVEEIVQGLLS